MLEPRARKPRPPVLAGNLSLIAGRSWRHRLFWLVILVAAGVDIVTFYQVLVLVLNVSDQLVWVAVAGFTVVALTLAHYVGLGAKQSIRPRIRGAATSAWICLGVWLALGAFAFVVRWEISPQSASVAYGGDGSALPDFGQSVDLGAQRLAALLFLGLYFGTGVVSALGGFFRHEPAIKEYTRALSKRTTVARRQASTGALLMSAKRTLEAVQQERERSQRAWDEIDQQGRDGTEQLRQEARLKLLKRRRSWPSAPPRARGRVFVAGNRQPPTDPTGPLDPDAVFDPNAAYDPDGVFDTTVPLEIPGPPEPPAPPTQRRGSPLRDADDPNSSTMEGMP
ncbi:MAG TPA: hypothetical protein VEO01_33375 [Pseudonocardiaceae bacterium]|nr:hypothetical protein [Pseudonocardiaceae bacterium]